MCCSWASLYWCYVSKCWCKQGSCVDSVREDEEHSHMLLRRVGGGWGGGYLPALTQHSSSVKDYLCGPCIRKLCFSQPFLLCNHGDVTFQHGFIEVCAFYGGPIAARTASHTKPWRSHQNFIFESFAWLSSSLSSTAAQDEIRKQSHYIVTKLILKNQSIISVWVFFSQIN